MNGDDATTHAGDEAARWFYQNSLDMFVVLRLGVIERVNPAWTDVTGWGVEESIGRDLRTLLHPDEEEILRTGMQSLSSTGYSRSEHRLATKAGGWTWVASRAKRAQDGTLIVVMQDIAEEHRLADEREQAQRATELLRSAAGVYIWRYSPADDLYVVDPDLSRPGAPGVPGSRVLTSGEMGSEIHPEDLPRINETFMRTITTGVECVLEYRHLHEESGDYRRMRVAWRGMKREPSGFWQVLGMTQDVTELAEARDAALRGEAAANLAAEAKAEFLSNMSHEIRTPMNGVLGVLHLLKNEPLSGEGRRLLDEAVGCGAMLSELLNDVIDFEKIEAGRLELHAEPLDPAALMESVADLLRPQAQGRGLYLRTTAPENPGWVSADPVRLRQVLFNLMGNAVKFTLRGGVEARLKLVGMGPYQRLRIEVQDTGVGIDAEASARLFDRFQQADGSTTRQFGGSGLGLAITRNLARIMDGDVGFESRPGEGSTFWIDIAAPAAEPVEQASDLPPSLLEGLRVLVVEDNPTNRLIATKMLETLGAAVETADDGAQGVEAVRRSRFDLVCMDVQMPVLDGVEATRRIRAMPAPAGATPILAMTANAMSHQTDSYRAAGMNGAVAKPLSPAALVAAILALAEDEPERVAQAG